MDKSEKKTKRWTGHGVYKGPAGSYSIGLDNKEFLIAVGALATLWPQVEDGMVSVFQELLGVPPYNDLPIRQLYKSVINAQARISMMRNMLEESRFNSKRGEEYDEILSDFETLNKQRNKYIHGLWSTHQSGVVFIAEYSMDDLWVFHSSRRVELGELQAVIQKMKNLNSRLIKMRIDLAMEYQRNAEARRAQESRG